MIIAYHRPTTLEEAVQLLSRRSPLTLPLGGGTVLSHHRAGGIEVVDLQALGMNAIKERGKVLEVGATATLQQLLEAPMCPSALMAALRLEAPLNLRNSASMAGALVTADGRSTLVTALLALDAQLSLKLAKADKMGLGEYLPLRGTPAARFLITAVEWPLAAALAFDYVARTPADKPICCVAVARWPSGRTRTAVGGWGAAPMLAMDGPDAGGVAEAARNAFHDAADAWGSAEYRMDAAAVLAGRCLSRLN